eukprot:3772789-Heterocapsa_arctica.AAC.1
MLEKVAGHLVNYFVLHRPGLASMRHIYTFCERNRGQEFVKFSQSLIHEFNVIRGLVFVTAERDLATPHAGFALCGDSSMKGYA